MRNCIVALATVAVLVVAGTGRADFVLVDNGHLEVTSEHGNGVLYDSSTAAVRAGANIKTLNVNNDSSVAVWGGNTDAMNSYDTSTVDISGGAFGDLSANNTSSVTVSDGTFVNLSVHDTSNVEISGGRIYRAPTGQREGGRLDAYDGASVEVSGGSTTRLTLLDTSRAGVL